MGIAEPLCQFTDRIASLLCHHNGCEGLRDEVRTRPQRRTWIHHQPLEALIYGPIDLINRLAFNVAIKDVGDVPCSLACRCSIASSSAAVVVA